MHGFGQAIKAIRWETPGVANSGAIRIMTHTKEQGVNFSRFLRAYSVDCAYEPKTPITRGLSEPNIKIKIENSDEAMQLCRKLVFMNIATAGQLEEWGFKLRPASSSVSLPAFRY